MGVSAGGGRVGVEVTYQRWARGCVQSCIITIQRGSFPEQSKGVAMEVLHVCRHRQMHRAVMGTRCPLRNDPMGSESVICVHMHTMLYSFYC